MEIREKISEELERIWRGMRFHYQAYTDNLKTENSNCRTDWQGSFKRS